MQSCLCRLAVSRLEPFYGEADMMGTPEAASSALHPDQWRSLEDIVCCSMKHRSKASLSQGCFPCGSNEEA